MANLVEHENDKNVRVGSQNNLYNWKTYFCKLLNVRF